MTKLSLEELRELREAKKKEFCKRGTKEDSNIYVIIGMGTCGIAAGAKEVYNIFIEEIEEHSLKNIVVQQTGCMGLCHSEPTVEVIMPEMPAVVYGDVDTEVVRDIVINHIIGKKLINKHIFEKPAIDIIK